MPDIMQIIPSRPPTAQQITKIEHGRTLKNVTGTISATTTIISAVPGKRIKVVAYSLITGSTTLVTSIFNDGVGGTAKWTVPLQAPTGTVVGANLSIEVPSYLFATTSSNDLELALSTSQSVTYSIAYFDDDVN